MVRDRVQCQLQSCPLDLTAIDAQLLSVQREHFTTPPLPSAEETETQDCMQLIREGACPVYSIDLIGEVTQNPAKYHDILSPWIIGDDYMVFREQWLRWQEFRQWQRFNRGDFEAWGKPELSIEVELAYTSLLATGARLADIQQLFGIFYSHTGVCKV